MVIISSSETAAPVPAVAAALNDAAVIEKDRPAGAAFVASVSSKVERVPALSVTPPAIEVCLELFNRPADPLLVGAFAQAEGGANRPQFLPLKEPQQDGFVIGCMEAVP